MNPSDPIGRPRKAGALFARLLPVVFHKKDTIPLLRALLEFSSLKKTLIVYDREDEYEFVRPRLECSPSKQQFKAKCVQLKKLYRSKLSEGAAEGGLTGDDAVIFELSDKLWGEEIMLQSKEKEREKSARAGRLGELPAVLGLEDGSDEGGGDVLVKSEGQLSGMVSGTGGKRKSEDEPGKIGGMVENVSGDDVLDDRNGEIVGSDKSSAKPGSEDGESARKVSLKKEKKRKGVENGKLAKAEDSRAKSGLADGSSASYGSRKEKKHKRRELDNFSNKRYGIEDDSSAISPEDSRLDKGEKSGKKKKHKGDEAGEFKRLSEGGELARNFLEKENSHKGDEKSQKLSNLSKKGSVSSQLEDGKSSKKKKKKHKGDRSYIRSRHNLIVSNGIDL